MLSIENRTPCPLQLESYTSVIDVAIRFAFQPLVDARDGQVVAQEALVRGYQGESAATVITGVHEDNLFYFDQACRQLAIRDADRAGIETDLHLNCSQIDASNLDVALAWTADAVDASRIRRDQIVLEFSSLERLGNVRELAEVRRRVNQLGFRVAADNFGTGEAGLKRLAVLRPDFVKLDRELISGIDRSPRRQAMVHGVIAACRALGTAVIGIGVENAAEARWLVEAGVDRVQGYHYQRPWLAERTPPAEDAESDFSELAFCAA